MKLDFKVNKLDFKLNKVEVGSAKIGNTSIFTIIADIPCATEFIVEYGFLDESGDSSKTYLDYKIDSSRESKKNGVILYGSIENDSLLDSFKLIEFINYWVNKGLVMKEIAYILQNRYLDN